MLANSMLKNKITVLTGMFFVFSNVCIFSDPTEKNNQQKTQLPDMEKEAKPKSVSTEINNLKKQINRINKNISNLSKNGINIAPEDMEKVQKLQQQAEKSLPTAEQALSIAKEVKASVKELQNKGLPLRSEDATLLDESLGKVNEVSGQIEKLEERIKELEENLKKSANVTNVSNTATAKLASQSAPAFTAITQEDKQKILALSSSGSMDTINQLIASPALSHNDKKVVEQVAQLGQQVAKGSISEDDAEQIIATQEANQSNVVTNVGNQNVSPVDTTTTSLPSDAVLSEELLPTNNEYMTKASQLADGTAVNDMNILNDDLLINNTSSNDLLLPENTVTNENSNDALLKNNLQQQDANASIAIDSDNVQSNLVLSQNNTFDSNDDLLPATQDLYSNDALPASNELSPEIPNALESNHSKTDLSATDLSATDLSDGDLLNPNVQDNANDDIVSNSDLLLPNGHDSEILSNNDVLKDDVLVRDELLSEVSVPQLQKNVENELVPNESDQDIDLLVSLPETENTLNVLDDHGDIKTVPVDALKDKVLRVAE